MFAVDLVSRFSKASLVLVGHEWETVERVAEVGKAFLHDRALKWLRSHSLGEHILTPVTTKERWTFSGGSLGINRSGSSLRELLVQRVLMRDAKGHSNVFLAELVPLTAGKSSWNLFRAQRQMFSTAREYLHKGLVVSHYS